MNEQLRFPVGKFERVDRLSAEQRAAAIDTIARLPASLRAAIDGLDDAQLDTPYRPGGWNVRQVVHHLPDSHMNALSRFKLALTENRPLIKTYAEDRWAELPDGKAASLEPSLKILDGLHERWVGLLRAMAPEDFERTLDHPEWGHIDLDTMLQLYEWHCRHHVAHITSLREREGWS